jgi:hypothetical protein
MPPSAPSGRVRRCAAVASALTALILAAGCGSSGSSTSTAGGRSGTDASAAVSGGTCPYVVDVSKADFYPIQPSFSAGYTAAAQSLNTQTAGWAYVVEADFPYSNWTAWYLYDSRGVPLFKFSDTALKADSGSVNPFAAGAPVLAPKRRFQITFMPATTPPSVVSAMQADGENVALMPAVGSTPGVTIVSRSYWSFGNDGLGDYDRFGYGGPTDTPYPVITAYPTDPSTGEITDTPVSDCGAQSQIPQPLWYDAADGAPVLTFEDAPVPRPEELGDLPKFLVQTGSFSGTLGSESPPSPDPQEVWFYRNDASKAPYADVQSAPPKGDPPDACGGYVMANLPNDVVSLVHIPQVPSYPDYRGATSETPNTTGQNDVAFYSVVIYGSQKQLDAPGTLENSQLGNRQLRENADGSATVVLYPRSATPEQVRQIDAVVRANGWNLLRSGTQTAVAPNLLVIREKGQNPQWKYALSANEVTQGAPCPQSADPDLPLPQDPESAAVTQTNGMGLTAPQGQNCTIADLLSGACLQRFQDRLRSSGARWSASGGWPAQRQP